MIDEHFFLYMDAICVHIEVQQYNDPHTHKVACGKTKANALYEYRQISRMSYVSIRTASDNAVITGDGKLTSVESSQCLQRPHTYH